MRRTTLLPALAGLLALTAAAPAGARGDGAWTASWAAAPQPPSSGAGPLIDRTLREIVHTSAGGDAVRIRISNVFGTRPLTLDAATVGLRASGAALRPGSERAVTFSGHASAVVPAGAELFSDPVPLAVGPDTDLAVSLYAATTTAAPTVHHLADTTNYAAPGNRTADAAADAFTAAGTAWTVVDGVDVRRDCPADTVVALGDSITDGVHAVVDADATWPQDLARRLDATGPCAPGVVNEGINGNRLLTDAAAPPDNAQARFDADVSAQSGARTVVLLEGVNDIGHDLSATGGPATAQDVIDGLRAPATRAHQAGLRIVGGTLLPIGGSKYDTPAAEAMRGAVNAWIRTGGAFDGVADFDRAVRDPADPARLLPAYDSGDGLHPDDAGYRAMAGAVDLRSLRP